jgi:hypothetical protein
MSFIAPSGDSRFLIGIVVFAAFLAGCGTEAGPPEEFPPVELGMAHEEVRGSMIGAGGKIAEENERMMSIVERDRRVAEETFFFYHDKLAAWTVRFAEEPTRRGFTRLAKRFTMAYGDPIEESDDGWVLRATWRIPDGGGRLLLSGFIGGRGPDTPLTARLEDPSVMQRLIREMRREDVDTIEREAAEEQEESEKGPE